MNDRFQEKVIIVTGAASGIGEATARRFAAEGAKVALVGRNKDALEKVAKSLPADRTIAHAADVSDSGPSTQRWPQWSIASAGWTSS
ncbi:SDR family oxidoreductase [Bradyrhizobium sp. B120]|uniref:SDR family oxidoreductase n=1 Tax=Bradyrhizobium sp. B120 TaxID=3410088 RepID=UPI003B9865CC